MTTDSHEVRAPRNAPRSYYRGRGDSNLSDIHLRPGMPTGARRFKGRRRLHIPGSQSEPHGGGGRSPVSEGKRPL